MRLAPASYLKARGRRGRPLQRMPREGTKLRGIYDLLMLNKGLPIEVSGTCFSSKGRFIYDLVDYYGLDIRKLGYGRWVLAGEWFGKVYVDYIAERIAETRS